MKNSIKFMNKKFTNYEATLALNLILINIMSTIGVGVFKSESDRITVFIFILLALFTLLLIKVCFESLFDCFSLCQIWCCFESFLCLITLHILYRNQNMFVQMWSIVSSIFKHTMFKHNKYLKCKIKRKCFN